MVLKREFLEYTISCWEPKYEQVLNSEDARQIVYHLTEFFNILQQWDEQERCADVSMGQRERC